MLATQNPIESEGTYNLPEAQLDRFMFKLVVDYPGGDEEAEILKLHSRQVDVDQRLADELQTVTSPEEIVRHDAAVRPGARRRQAVRLHQQAGAAARAQWPQFHLGASPRAGIALVQGARTLAAFYGRDYAVPDDVVQIALPALRHRVILTAEAEVEGHKVDDLLQRADPHRVEVPRLYEPARLTAPDSQLIALAGRSCRWPVRSGSYPAAGRWCWLALAAWRCSRWRLLALLARPVMLLAGRLVDRRRRAGAGGRVVDLFTLPAANAFRRRAADGPHRLAAASRTA